MITLVINPPFRKQVRIYRKFARKFDKDIWILCKSDNLKEPLIVTKLIDFDFDKDFKRTRVAYNDSSCTETVKFAGRPEGKQEFIKFKKANDIDLSEDRWSDIDKQVVVKLMIGYHANVYNYRIIETEKQWHTSFKQVRAWIHKDTYKFWTGGANVT